MDEDFFLTSVLLLHHLLMCTDPTMVKPLEICSKSNDIETVEAVDVKAKEIFVQQVNDMKIFLNQVYKHHLSLGQRTKNHEGQSRKNYGMSFTYVLLFLINFYCLYILV